LSGESHIATTKSEDKFEKASTNTARTCECAGSVLDGR
jgi:hypothetical protein